MKKFAIALSLCLGMAAAAHAEIRYSITGVETADGYVDDIWGINSSGAVTGSFLAGGTREAFLYDGAVTRLGTGGTSVGIGRTINDKGVVGGMFGTVKEGKPFLFDGTTTLDLTTVDARVAGSGVMDVNNKGEALLYGFYAQPSEFALRNFFYDGSVMTDLVTPDSSKIWFTLNDVGGFGGIGGVAGQPGQPFVFDGTDTVYLPNTSSGPFAGAALALNEDGWATGITNMGNGYHAFRYNGTTSIDLGALGSSSWSYGYAINGFGTVVGYSTLQSGLGDHAFIYGSAGMEDLNAFIDPASGWVLTQARGINDAGQIAGVGIYNGQTRGFILNPLAAVPEPASWAMMVAGFAVVGAGLRRKASLSIRYAIA